MCVCVCVCVCARVCVCVCVRACFMQLAPQATLCDVCKMVTNFLKPYVDSNSTEVCDFDTCGLSSLYKEVL